MDEQSNEGMRWQNSPSVRGALEAMTDALKRHDSDMGYMLDCKQRVKDAEGELEKAELRFGETQAQMMTARDKLEAEGFLINKSVYEPS